MQTAAQLEYRLLGSLEVRREGERLELGAGKQRALLAMLLLNSNRILSTDRLIEALWPKKSPGRPQTAVQGYVSHLRRLLEPERKPGEPFSVLVTEPAGYVLKLEPMQLDIHCFERVLEQAREALEAGQAQAAARLFAEGLSLFRGQPLADFTYEGWAQQEIVRLEELQLAAIEARIDAEMAQGQAGELVGELEALVQSHPLRERLRAQLMLALYRGGRQAEALQAYQLARTALVSDLGIDPSPELQQLYKAILNQEQALAVPAPASPSNLPTPPTPLVGRQKELTELRGLLERSDVRLLTLTGAGGSGKTRLALEVAGGAASEFPDGVWWVPLAALADPALVLPAIAQTLGAKSGLTDHLRRQNTLLLLDNFEQVVEAATGLAELLAQASDVKVLATSRVALRLSGEHEWPVPPLEGEDAAALFGERARAVKPTFEPDEHVTEICTRLDNMPLALELAAARVNVLAPEQILERLGHSLDLLTTGKRDAPERHRTLRATIEWSYNLLSETERHLFARLAVFAGTFDLEAAETVCTADLDPLGSLVDNSLLRQTDDGRFFMLETIREYASERLDEADDADERRRRHALHFLEFLKRADEPIRNGPDPVWVRRVDVDHQNLRAAIRWACETNESALAVELVNLLAYFWWLGGYATEARRWHELALAVGSGQPVRERARALVGLSRFSHVQHDYERAREAAQESLDLARQCNDVDAVIRALNELGNVAQEQRAYDRASAFYDEALAVAKAHDDVYWSIVIAGNLGQTLLLERRGVDRARTLYRETLAAAREQEYPLGILAGLIGSGMADLVEGECEAAAALLKEALLVAAEIPFPEMICECLRGLAVVAISTGDAVGAAGLLGAVEELEGTIAASSSFVAELFDETASFARSALGDDAFAGAVADGRGIDLETAIERALAID